MTENPHQSFYDFMERELNPAQKEAVIHMGSPLLVIAGAGSGKTRVITARIAHLMIEHEVLPAQIIALTFTNKAAQEMKERITSFLEPNVPVPFVGTFHAYCLQLLKKYKTALKVPFKSMLDAEDQKKMIADILKRGNLHKQFTATNMTYQISSIKNKMADDVSSKLFINPLIHDIYTAYEKEKSLSACFDFDDLLLHAVQLFKMHEPFKKEFQRTVRHILVDEYQDTNLVQHSLLKLMALDGKKVAVDSVCAVGDEDQSIYSWRGADVTNMLTFSKDFPKTMLIKIEQNYRSVQPILSTANSIIERNTQRNPKLLWSEKKAVDRIRLITCSSEYQESDALAQLALTIHKNIPHKQSAVLYRTHAQSRAIEEALIKNSVPYTIIGGIQFYERKEIKDLLAYIKLVINPYDRTSLFRILNVPTRGLGEKFEDQFRTLWNYEPFLSFQDIIRTFLNQEDTSPSRVKALTGLLNAFVDLSPQTSAVTALEQIIQRIHYRSYIKDSCEKDEAIDRLENIDELIKAAIHFEKESINTVSLFLDEISLLQEKKTDNEQEKEHRILLMTLHAAKGLEFDVVMLPGLEEHTIPSSRSLESNAAVQEERRLLYVGITRAREYLLLSHAQVRTWYGKTNSTIPSRFLEELPRSEVSQDLCVHWRSYQFESYFNKWLSINAPIKASEPVFTFGKKSYPEYLNVHAAQKDNTLSAVRQRSNTTLGEKSSPKKSGMVFGQLQPVVHKKYGVGIVQHEEPRPDGSVCVTVQFKEGVKKIMAKFLEKQ